MDGKADALGLLLQDMVDEDRKTIKIDELRERAKKAFIEYEKAWNKWADEAKIGGKRYTEEGLLESKVRKEAKWNTIHQ